MSDYLIRIGKQALVAKRPLAVASDTVKNNALKAIATALVENYDTIIAANKVDLIEGKKAGLSPSLLDRLALSKERIKSIADAVLEITALPDPVGRILSGSVRPNGLNISKVSVPLGVIAVIYEARPNVTADAAALCLKSGNTVILRGGKEAINSNKAIAMVMRNAIEPYLPVDSIQLIEDTSRETAQGLMKMKDYVDVLIPRGGAGLIRSVVENSTVPVIETGTGNCHIYVDCDADIDLAAEIVFNAKTSRPSVCNAAESLVLHKDIAELALIAIASRLETKKVEIRGDKAAQSILPTVKAANEEDWGKEYLDYIISVKIVNNIDEAISHIDKYTTHHSECIVTESFVAAEEFLKRVDAAAVYVNASTRYTDGGEFGFGAEIGISTQKLHARGPVGLFELTSYKYIIRGQGQVR